MTTVADNFGLYVFGRCRVFWRALMTEVAVTISTAEDMLVAVNSSPTFVTRVATSLQHHMFHPIFITGTLSSLFALDFHILIVLCLCCLAFCTIFTNIEAAVRAMEAHHWPRILPTDIANEATTPVLLFHIGQFVLLGTPEGKLTELLFL